MARSIDSVLCGRRVEALKGGVRLTVELSGGVAVVVENDFRLHAAAEVEHFYPGLTMEPSGPLNRLVGSGIAAVRVTPAGALELTFDSGPVLSVPPDTSASGSEEAWRVLGPDGPLFTAVPGGYLTS